MKTRIGVDSRTKLIHSVAATAANVHDSQLLPDLLHGGETRIWGDAAYTGQSKVIRKYAPKAQNFTQKKGSRHRFLTNAEYAKNRAKSRVRAKVEHLFLILKRVASTRSVTGIWTRTPTGCSWVVGWLICTWREGDWRARRRVRVPKICQETRISEQSAQYWAWQHRNMYS